MKIVLIAPASGLWRHVGRRGLFNGKTFRFSLLSLLRVAAETPAGHELQILDEQIQEIPDNLDADLVGLTCMTAAAPRAYELAHRFRARSIPVVLGGMHPTLCPGEAASHADAIVMGEAEGLWGQVVADCASGRLKRVYRADAPPDLAALKPAPIRLLQAGRYATVHAVQATRGCPHACQFCSVTAFHQGTQRHRPVRDVCAEVAAIPGRFVLFVDDNLTADPDYARALFEALTPLRKLWVAQASLALTEESGLVADAARSGCIGLFVGLETFSEANLLAVDKTCHRVPKYRTAIDLLHSHGIAVEAGVVFGFDKDGPDVFENTLRILDQLEIDAVQVSIFTPLPGTPVFRTYQPRITDRNWEKYDFHHAVFAPRLISARALQAGHDWVTRSFYHPVRIMRRLWRHLGRPRAFRSFPYVAAVNGAYYGRVVRWGIRGWNPSIEKMRAGPVEAASPV